MVHEPMTDLIKLMSKLVDHNGHILIPGIEEMVAPPDENEMCVLAFQEARACLRMRFRSKLYTKMDYSVADVTQAAGGSV